MLQEFRATVCKSSPRQRLFPMASAHSTELQISSKSSKSHLPSTNNNSATGIQLFVNTGASGSNNQIMISSSRKELSNKYTISSNCTSITAPAGLASSPADGKNSVQLYHHSDHNNEAMVVEDVTDDMLEMNHGHSGIHSGSNSPSLHARSKSSIQLQMNSARDSDGGGGPAGPVNRRVNSFDGYGGGVETGQFGSGSGNSPMMVSSPHRKPGDNTRSAGDVGQHSLELGSTGAYDF
jgi:hypothetical protein